MVQIMSWTSHYNSSKYHLKSGWEADLPSMPFVGKLIVQNDPICTVFMFVGGGWIDFSNMNLTESLFTFELTAHSSSSYGSNSK